MLGVITVATTLMVFASNATIEAQYAIDGRAARVEPVASQDSSEQGGDLLNPSFEDNGGVGTNQFDDWTVVDTGSAGSWYVQSGGIAPFGIVTVDPPTHGTVAAMTDQILPGSHILYQDFAVPAGGALLSVDLFVLNQALDYANPPSLSCDLIVPNQQVRVDLMDPLAPVPDVGAGVLLNMFATLPGDPLMQPYQTITADLGPWSGTTVRLRIAEVDNQSYLNAGVDNVLVQAYECFLVIGDGPGDASFFEIGHLFQTQVGPTVEDSHAVLLNSIPEFVLPTPLATIGLGGVGTRRTLSGDNGSTPSWMLDGHFAVQVLMWNPQVFPQLPEQCTQGLFVTVQPDGTVLTESYGTDVGGMTIWHEIDTDAAGQKVIRFPFAIPGM